MDFTGLYNAIMQLIFIITGLASIKSLTEMITQLVGQGDALKDGADTAKEVKSMAAKAGGAALHGAGLAGAGVKAAIGVAGRVGNSAWAKSAGSKLNEKAGDWVDRRKVNRNARIDRKAGKGGFYGVYADLVKDRRDRLAVDDKYMAQLQDSSRWALKSQEYRHKARNLRAQGKDAEAKDADITADKYEKASNKAWHNAIDIQQHGIDGKKVSRRGRIRGGADTVSLAGKYFGRGSSQAYKEASRGMGFEDGIGIKAMIKGDKEKDTVINQFLNGNYKRDAAGNIEKDAKGNRVRDEKNSFSTTINNANKFVFNITGMKGTVKEMLDNADVLETIEAGDTELARQMQRVLAQTGAKSDKKKAMEASAGQAKATADALAAKNNETMKAILDALEAIKNKP